jgi:hypothetical protein
MAEFDPNSYFQTRFNNLQLSKPQEVVEAMREKVAGLERYQAGIAARTPQILAQEEADRNSLVGKWGLDPDGAAATAVDLGARLWEGTTRVAGNILSAPVDAVAGPTRPTFTAAA